MRRIVLRTTVLASIVVTAAVQAQPRPVPTPTPKLPTPAPTLKVPTPVQPTPVQRTPLWGYADLHVHPATHFAFGADASGNGGPFWGRPGMKLETSNIATDLPPCARDKHSGFDADLVRHQTRIQVVGALESGTLHGSGGAPSFDAWPNARSRIHQTMHISWIRRAYEGGLRLVVASTTDSQLLGKLWKHGTNFTNVGLGRPDPNYDYESAKRQIKFIKDLAAANSGWMTVVKSAAEARAAIAANKLAVILGVEFDKLTADQILDLARNHGVRSVIPIHLTNNDFGGTAVYDDLFNTSNKYVNGEFFRVVGDDKISSRLSADTQELVDPGGIMGFFNAVLPSALKRSEYCALGYECCPEQPKPGCILLSRGHRNALGLTAKGKTDLRRLMKEGLLVDIAHMSATATEEALRIAEAARMPVMDSHTGLRNENACASTERHLTFGHARRIGALGGVIGLGTEGEMHPTPVLHEAGTPLVRFTGSMKSKTWYLRPPSTVADAFDKVKFEIRTGGDDLRGGNDNAFGYLVFADNTKKEFPLNNGARWGNDSTNVVMFDVPGTPRLSQLRKVGVRTTFGGGIGGDNWNMDRIVTSVRVAGKWVNVLHASGAPVVRFTGQTKDWTKNVSNPSSLTTCNPAGALSSPSTVVPRIAVTVKTGGDDLRGGNDNAEGVLKLKGGRTISFSINNRLGISNGAIVTRYVDLPAGTRISDLESLTIRTTFSGGVAGDNWNIDELRVDTLTDPVTEWAADYQEALGLLGNRGVALGSDINGLAPQIPFTALPVRYPIDVAQRVGMPGTSPLQKHRVLNRTFDFRTDGIAHIGMFPDFMQALSAAPNGMNVVSKLYRSANDVVEMWEKIEAAAKNL